MLCRAPERRHVQGKGRVRRLTVARQGLYSSGVLRACSALRLIGALAAATCGASAAAQSKSALSWVREPGAESCIGTVELGQRVERLVGPMLVPAPEGQVSVEGRIARSAGGFVAEISVADANGKVLGHRQLKRDGGDCRALDEELAFVIAVAIDPNAALAELPGELSAVEDPGGELLADLRAAPSAPAAAAASARAAAPGTRAQPKPVRAPESEPEPIWRVALEPAIGFGNLPAVAGGLQLGFGAALGDDFVLWLRGSAWLPQEVTARRDAAVSIGAFGFALALCPLALHDAPWSMLACAGAVADVLVAEPVEFAMDAISASKWVFGPELELRAGFTAGAGFWLGLSGALQSRWPRHEIGFKPGALSDVRPVYTPPLVSGRLALVLELRF